MFDVIIAAAGTGNRFSDEKNKMLFTFQNGETVLERTLSAFVNMPEKGEIFITASECDFTRYQEIASQVGAIVVLGGASRAESVYNALLCAKNNYVLIHDGARPFVSATLIERICRGVKQYGAVIPVIPVSDTVKIVDGDAIKETPDRNCLFGAQTPQAFLRTKILAAYKLAEKSKFTDDSSIYEKYEGTVRTVEGERTNKKITYPEDATALGTRDIITGIGYDAHRLVEGRKLMLGCVSVPHDKGLLGHSDADVLAHAICDALLSAAHMRDIGVHFPDNAKETEGMSGEEILKRTARLIGNYRVLNVSAVIIAQKPKLAAYIPEMEKRTAEALGINPNSVSVSATTTEKMGFEGREEGISAQAVCTLQIKA